MDFVVRYAMDAYNSSLGIRPQSPSGLSGLSKCGVRYNPHSYTKEVVYCDIELFGSIYASRRAMISAMPDEYDLRDGRGSREVLSGNRSQGEKRME